MKITERDWIEAQNPLIRENRELKEILRKIWNIKPSGNMEYFGEQTMQILIDADKSLWEEK